MGHNWKSLVWKTRSFPRSWGNTRTTDCAVINNKHNKNKPKEQVGQETGEKKGEIHPNEQSDHAHLHASHPWVKILELQPLRDVCAAQKRCTTPSGLEERRVQLRTRATVGFGLRD